MCHHLLPHGAAELTALIGGDFPLRWLHEDIGADRTPELRQFINRELGVQEMTPDAAVLRLTKTFLEAQSDEWVVRLYEFLGPLAAVQRTVVTRELPILRLESGQHVSLLSSGRPSAFLPSQSVTEFPTVRRAVSAKPTARALLVALGVTVPDPVDDVIWNLLPSYIGGVEPPEGRVLFCGR